MPLIMDASVLHEACSINNWLEDFRDITIPTNIVKVPQKLLEYFRDDLMILPTECQKSENDDTWGDDGDDDQVEFSFPEFSEIVSRNLKSFCRRGPGCFLKANWHAPVDAKWINTGQSLCVQQLDEFYQILKASDIFRADLNRTGGSTGSVIAFRQYLSHIHPGSEFRCYVKRHELIGITSRWWPEFFQHFVTDKTAILNEVQQFFSDHIQNKFPLQNYIFDVIRDDKTNSIILVDFAPLLKENFKRLAFSWEELDCDVVEFETPEFRYLEQSVQQQQRHNEEPGSRNSGPPQFAEIQPNFDNYKFGFPIDFQEQSLSDLLPAGLQDFLNKDH